MVGLSKPDYHLFGDFYLDSPEEHLAGEDLARLRKLEPLINDLRHRKTPDNEYDLEKAFARFMEKEQAAWRHLGVERPRAFLVYPAGHLSAPIACHLHNPTFFVSDPFLRQTDNKSNPTMQQIFQAGFSSLNSLIYDHICRRDRTEDVLLFYTKELITIHEDFMLSLRKSMAAKVEICWGKPVRQRMKELLNLIPLKLWGDYKDVELFLELDDDSIVRFVIFVCHPQHFFYHSHFTEDGIRFRETKGRKQDLYLTVASKLAGITIQRDFYEVHHRPATYGKLKREERKLVKELETDADSQLQTAFPQKYAEIETSAKSLMKLKEPQSDVKWAESTLSDTIKATYQAESTLRLKQFNQLRQSWANAAAEIFSREGINLGTSAIKLLSNLETSDWTDISQWDEIPTPLTAWIQSQDGLKIDNMPINSKDELITAYYLLWIKDDPASQTLMHILFKVANTYVLRVCKQRRSAFQDNVIPGANSHRIMPRKCSKCGQRVLDDAFACYAKTDPKIYITFYRMFGCGRPSCGVGFANLIPTRPGQAFRRASTPILTNIKTAEWEEYLLRCSTEERKGLPQVLEIRCTSCNVEVYRDCKPRWTTENPARYVRPVMKCNGCECRLASWDPVDTTITCVAQSSLSRKWKSFKAFGIEPKNYPRRPDIYWSRTLNSTKLKALEKALKENGDEDLGKHKKERRILVKTRTNA